MLTRVIKNGSVWIESTEGFKVHPDFPNGNASNITYHEGDRFLYFDAGFWHESPEDRQADITKMSPRRLEKYLKRTLTLVSVPEVLRWRETDEIVAPEDRSRILENLRSALEFDSLKPRFVKA